MDNNSGIIILDNGGGIMLQLGAFAHLYDDAMPAATDLAAWLADSDTSGWDGHEPEMMVCAPTDEQIRNGGYRTVRLCREVDTLALLAVELNDFGWANGEALADRLTAIAVAA